MADLQQDKQSKKLSRYLIGGRVLLGMEVKELEGQEPEPSTRSTHQSFGIVSMITMSTTMFNRSI